MIYVNFQGGLGNQMFQYAYGRTLQERFHEEVMYVGSSYVTDKLRNLNIENFNIDTSWKPVNNDFSFFSDKKKRKAVIDCINNIMKGSTEKYTLLSKIKYSFFQYLGYYNQFYLIDIYPHKSFSKDIYVSGFWHNEKYFTSIVAQLRNELRFKQDLTSKNADYLQQIKNTNSVCVHIRRGDYLEYSGYLVCTNKYYTNSILYIDNRIANAQYYIFSDDITWVRQNLPKWFEKDSDLIKNINYIEEKNPDYVDFELMRNCKSFVISNSTFSWWASYLGEALDKIVCAPSKWYGDGRKKDGIYLNSWTKIDV